MSSKDELCTELVDYILENEAEDFHDWLANGDGAAAEGVDESKWESKCEDIEGNWDWLAKNTNGHIYCAAYRLQDLDVKVRRSKK